MRTPRTLAAIALGLSALSFAPALADEQPAAETVDITVDLDAPAEEIYETIRSQAWTACKIEPGSHYIAARMNARRACQRAMIADVVKTLEAPEVIRLAQQSGIRVKS
jgi:UrcA family protein